ncbi:ATP-binding protein [Lactobacillus sp. Marseille-P7033]|nr:ATP-binding protein [Lactobacillus sp. Marseille-P7033]NGC78920.1 ATP-binding protein [Limosilactobacillus reuteri]
MRQQLEFLETDYDKEKAINIEKSIKDQVSKKSKLENENNSIKNLPGIILNDIPVEYMDDNFNVAIKEVIDKFKSDIKELIKKQTMKNSEEIKNIVIEIKALKEDSDYKKFQDFKAKTPQLDKIDSDINNEEFNLSERKKLENKLKNEKSNINSLCTQMYDLLTTGNDTVKILENDNLKFKYNLRFNFNEIKDLFANDFKTSSKSYKIVAQGMLKDLEEESKNLNDQINDFYNTMRNILNMDDKRDAFRKGKNIHILLNDLMAVELLKYDYSIFYNNKDFNQMSEGKKAFVLLLLKLKIENNDMPLLIDQPEDELDNRSIVNDLVELLRKQKEYRQIILVTHNANIVIGADSEQVIIASEKDGANSQKEKFHYEGGSLENNEVRGKICEILEGGKDAFKKRENRYNFKDPRQEALKN